MRDGQQFFEDLVGADNVSFDDELDFSIQETSPVCPNLLVK